MHSHRITLAVLAATLTPDSAASHTPETVPLVSHVVAQRAEPAAHQDDRSVEEIIDLIHRLEVGMSALEEVGARDTLHQVAEIAQRLRNSRDRVLRHFQGREEGHEREFERERTDLDELEFRMAILRHARHAYAEVGDERHVEYLNRVLHAAELQASGAGEEDLAQAMEDLSIGNVIELLARASKIWAEFGHESKAELCGELAEYYLHRNGAEGEEDRAEQEHEHALTEGEGEQLGDEERKALDRRVKVLGYAHDAHAEAGHPDRADMLERAVHIGHLALEGVRGEELARASEGFSSEALIGPLRSAAELYQEWGMRERAHACAELAQYYQARNTAGEEGERDRRGTELVERERRMKAEGKAVERRELAERRLDELRQQLDRLQEQMAGLRRELEEVTHALRGDR